MAKRILKPRIDSAKNKKDLDKIFKDLEDHKKRWGTLFSKKVTKLLKKWFDEKMKEL